MTTNKTASPSTPHPNELLLPTVRLGVFYDPHLKNLEPVKHVVLNSNYRERDPEVCFVQDDLGKKHPIGSILSDLNYHVGYFVADPEDKSWLRMWNEMAEYATHHLIFLRRADRRLRDFLVSDECHRRPRRVIMLD